MNDFTKLLNEKVLIIDGAMGSMINTYNLKPQDFGGEKYFGCSEQLLFTKPQVIEEIHGKYILSGADIIETNTFGASRSVMAEYGLENKIEEINLKAVETAKNAIAKTAKKKVFIAGSIGPTSKALSLDGSVSYNELFNSYYEQAAALIKGKVDLFLIETQLDILTAKCALDAAVSAMEKAQTRLPIIVSASFNKSGSMLSGQNVEAYYLTLRHYPITAMGFNCAAGPKEMKPLLQTLAKRSSFYIFAMPNAGLPDENGKYVMTAQEFAKEAASFAEEGLVNIIGGCCGTTPKHIEELSKLLTKTQKIFKPGKIQSAACGLEAVFFSEIKKPVLIGERCNSIGSKMFRTIVAEGSVDKAVSLAKKQAAAGAHILDVCLANPERNEKEDALLFTTAIAKAVRRPVMADSANIDTAKEILKNITGKAILNSVNLECGQETLIKAAALNKELGTVLVVGCIDENGMALTAQQKLEIAKRSHKILTQHGVNEADIIFDALVFPSASAQEKYRFAAKETIEGVRLIKKEFPCCQTLLGVSNVSFGLPPASREVLNSVFIQLAVKQGLDMAIINVEKLLKAEDIAQREFEAAERLLNDASKENVDAFAALYREEKAETKETKKETLSAEEKLTHNVICGDKAGLETLLGKLLEKYEAVEIIKGPLTKGMDIVGEKFSSGEMIITEVLQSAEVMKKASDYLAPHLKADDAPTRGKLLLATVKGDIHDIGKNLVSVIFKSNGFEVIDLGINIETDAIVKAAKEHKPDIIGLSGLLTRSAETMITVAKTLRAENINCALALGGAVLTEKFIETKITPVYGGKALYCATAMDGLQKAVKYCIEKK